MRRLMKNYIAGILLLLALAACKEREAPLTPLGPDIKLAPSGFTINSNLLIKQYGNDLDITDAAIRFAGTSADSLYFEASFSADVSWKIEITGLTSGAKKFIYGEGSSVTKSNSVWNGSHDELSFFSQNEEVQAVLSFYGTDVADTANITILQSKAFGDQPGHYLVLSTEALNGFASNPGYPAFFGFDENGSTIELVDGSEAPGVPQGLAVGTERTAMRINGNPADDIFLNGARSGALEIRPLGLWNAQHAFLVDDINNIPDEVKDPDQVWVNVYVYIPFVDVSKYMEIQLKESDDNGKNLYYTDSDDDAWIHRVPYDKVGWKLVSFKYSDTWASPARPFGGSGNKVREPHRCIGFQFNIYSQRLNESSWIAIDYPIFTIGGPFDPSK